jgi:hypothetical protein
MSTTLVRGYELSADHELQSIYNVSTKESYSFNEKIDLINDELGTDVEPKYVVNLLDEYVHDTMDDYLKLHAATGWGPTIDFEAESPASASRTSGPSATSSEFGDASEETAMRGGKERVAVLPPNELY